MAVFVNKMEALNNTRVFLRRLATLSGGVTSESDCFAFTHACECIDQLIKQELDERRGQDIETGVRAALEDLKKKEESPSV